MRLAVLLVTVMSGALSATAQVKWELGWHDEFDSPKLDRSKWTFDVGGGGWGNSELESYTNRPENAFIENGMLVIRVIAEDYTSTDGIPRKYTSARLKTQGLFAQAYGRFEARIKIPFGQGIWPAFWMLGEDIAKVGWPRCGEVDIMENIGKEPTLIHGTLHGPGYSGGGGLGGPTQLPGGARFADDFHLYAIEWQPGAVHWSVDGEIYKTVTSRDIPAGTPWVFDHPFFLLLNVAVGGDWPGNPDATSILPQQMLVDYVRVYRPRHEFGGGHINP